MDKYIPFNSGAIKASDCISDAWELIKDNYWMFWGMAMLGVVLLGCIPCVNVFLAGPLMVGIYIAVLTKMRGGVVTFDMLFKGFEKFVPAMVVGLIQNIPEIISTVLRFTINLADLGLKSRGGRDFDFFAPSDMAPALAGGLIVLIIIVVLASIAFGIAWHITFMMALPLLAEHDLGPMEAIKLSARAGWSNPGGIIVLAILQFLIMLLGVLALCIGWLFVIPVIIVSNFIAYRMVFPETSQNSVYNEPPRPDYYGGSFGAGPQ